MIGIGGVAGRERQHDARPGEAGDVVDMPVGVVVLQPRAQPDHLADAEIGRQQFLHVGPPDAGIAVGIEEHAFGREQRALAVGVDRATLEHERRLVAPHRQMLQHLFGHGGVALMVGICLPRRSSASRRRRPGRCRR